jgi:MoaA/NifB/PqqE/SkfB family radical SAM enzyme
MVVSLSGGDPFLRADLAEIVGLLAPRHVPVLTTHGWLVTAGNARAAWAAGLHAATVRFEHGEAAAHDAALGVPGAFVRARAALATLAEARTSPRQQVNVSAPVLGEAALEAVLAVAAEHRATVTVEPGYPLRPGVAASAMLLRLKKRHAHLRNSGAYLARVDEALGAGVPDCRAGRAFVNVDHRGRVSKCVEFRGPADQAGDLAREDVEAVLPRLRRLADENACRSCYYAFRGEVEALYGARGLLRAIPMLVRA